MPSARTVRKGPESDPEDDLDVSVDFFETRPGRWADVGHHHHRKLPFWHVRTCLSHGDEWVHQQRVTFSLHSLPRFIEALLKLRHDAQRRGLL